MLEAIAFVVSTAGLVFFALAMKTHWTQLRGARPQPSRVFLRTLGAACLVSAFVLLRLAESATIAPLVWTMMLIAGGTLLSLYLSRHPV